MLAGLFKAPARFAPHINLPAARARANVVLDNLVEAGFMTEGQVFGARRNPATALDRRDDRSPNYYLDWAFEEMQKLVDTLPQDHDRAGVPGAHRARCRPAERGRDRGREFAPPVWPRLSREPGRDGGRRPRRRGARHGRRARLRREPVQPRHRRAAPAGLVVQAVCLRDGAGQRHEADLDRGRRAGLHRQLVPAQLFRRLYRLDDADRRAQALDQHHRGQAVDLDRQRQRQGRPRQDRQARQGTWGCARRCRTRRRCRSAPTR